MLTWQHLGRQSAVVDVVAAAPVVETNKPAHNIHAPTLQCINNDDQQAEPLQQ